MAEVGHPVVPRGWLVIIQVLEAAHVRVSEVEWHIGVSVVDCTELFSFEEGLYIVLHDRCLNVGSVLSPRRLSIDAITESKNVGISLMLESVRANINHSILSGNA